VTDQNQLLRKWRIDYDNDTGNNDGGFWEWWTLTDGVRSFKCDSEADAQWLHAALSHPAQPAPSQPQVAGEAVDFATLQRMWSDYINRCSANDPPDRRHAYITGVQHGFKLRTTPPASQQAAQAVPTKPLFASAVAARKWEELQEQGHRMQLIQFDGGPGGPGTIGPWGVVMWGEPLSAVQAVPDALPALRLARDALTNSTLLDHERDWQLHHQASSAVVDAIDAMLRAAKGEQ
jgi:hypothetical protein